MAASRITQTMTNVAASLDSSIQCGDASCGGRAKLEDTRLMPSE